MILMLFNNALVFRISLGIISKQYNDMTELCEMLKELLVTNFHYLPRDSKKNKEITELRFDI